MEAHVASPLGLRQSARPPVRLGLLSDERLATLAGKGDERAFGVLYGRYHQPLYRYCRSLLRHDLDAQDALQSALANAFSALRRNRRDAPLRPWLFRIAHNEAISLLRRRRPEQELFDVADRAGSSLHEHFEGRERLSLLVADLLTLPERQRAALVMRELSGLSHEEIALALGGTSGSVKQTIFEARRSLQDLAEGRTMPCDDVQRLISDADGRSLRARRVRSHLRACSSCSAFAAAIGEREVSLRAFAPPLAPIAAGALLVRVVGGGAHSSAGPAYGAGAMTVGAAGKSAAGGLLLKAAAGAAVLATAAAGVTGVVHPFAPRSSAPVSPNAARAAAATTRHAGRLAGPGSATARASSAQARTNGTKNAQHARASAASVNGAHGRTGATHRGGASAASSAAAGNGNAHARGGGNPYAAGGAGNAHTNGRSGNPHTPGTPGNRHSTGTGNPHSNLPPPGCRNSTSSPHCS